MELATIGLQPKQEGPRFLLLLSPVRGSVLSIILRRDDRMPGSATVGPETECVNLTGFALSRRIHVQSRALPGEKISRGDDGSTVYDKPKIRRP